MGGTEFIRNLYRLPVRVANPVLSFIDVGVDYRMFTRLFRMGAVKRSIFTGRSLGTASKAIVRGVNLRKVSTHGRP